VYKLEPLIRRSMKIYLKNPILKKWNWES